MLTKKERKEQKIFLKKYEIFSKISEGDQAFT